MTATGQDTLKTRRTLTVGGRAYDYYALPAAEAQLGPLSRLPFSLKVLLENMLRFEDGRSVTVEDAKALARWLQDKRSDHEIAYRPARVLMQDFTGVPAVVDLAAMRHAVRAAGGNPAQVNPLSPVDLVIDHSVMVDHAGTPKSFGKNVALEFSRNRERYAFLRWGQKAFDNFRVVPPGTGICHQVNLEYLARCVWTSQGPEGRDVAYPDTLVGTDSHTTMVNGLGVLGWGVGGIEAEAVMLGQPVSMLIPEVVGCRLTGRLSEGVTATDLVLTVVQMLRKKGVVGKFVEFFGAGLDALSLADRATIANMAPEYGATCGIFPIDRMTLDYMTLTGRDAHQLQLTEAYAKAQGMWRDASSPEPVFTDVVSLDLSSVEACLAGPKRPQDRVVLSQVRQSFETAAAEFNAGGKRAQAKEGQAARPAKEPGAALRDGAVVIAAITSCTNTSNPHVLVAAGLVARKARQKGITVKPWVKTSFAPGSQVVSDYLAASGLQADLDALGFNVVGYGCTTCIGNSGPLAAPVAEAIEKDDLVVASVLSGNRNFEGRIHPLARCNYLASPPLVVAYALAGMITLDLAQDPLGVGKDGAPVFLKDLWPTNREIQEALANVLTPQVFANRYGNVFEGPPEWRAIPVETGETFDWDPASTYIQHPPYFEGMGSEPPALRDVRSARALVVLGDSVTTDHISPAGAFSPKTPAGHYLTAKGVAPQDFNSYGARRGSHEVMMRGTFANIRIRNHIAPGTEGGFTRYFQRDDLTGEVTTIYDAAVRYQADGVPLVVIGGKEYGTGSSRDWAAKGTALLGVRAVIVESFERIHRSNLIGMGVLPLQFPEGVNRVTLALEGAETFDIIGLEAGLTPRMQLTCRITRANGAQKDVSLLCRIDTQDEAAYYRHGGILHYVLRTMMKKG